MNEFTLHNVTCGYKNTPVLKDVSFSIGAGEAVCLLGPNGVGKTTLFRSMLGFLKLLGGRITLDGEDIATWNSRRLARSIGYVPQNHTPPFAYPVLDVVTMGRMSRISAVAAPSNSDVEIAYRCLEQLGVEHLADKLYTEVSGGERQMVLIARALAQQPKLLIMDEPTASLDYGNQVKVLRRIAGLVDDGISVVMTTHFPDHAFLCATKVGLITRNWVRFGDPADIVTEESLRETYGVEVRIVREDSQRYGCLKGCIPIVKVASETGDHQADAAAEADAAPEQVPPSGA